MRSGLVGLYDGALDTAGRTGYSWTRLARPSDSARAYLISFTTSTIGPSDYANRWGASPVCALSFPLLSYVRSGVIHLNNGTLDAASIDGFSWTRLAYSSSSTDAYFLGFSGTSNVNPSRSNPRWVAFPVHS